MAKEYLRELLNTARYATKIRNAMARENANCAAKDIIRLIMA